VKVCRSAQSGPDFVQFCLDFCRAHPAVLATCTSLVIGTVDVAGGCAHLGSYLLRTVLRVVSEKPNVVEFFLIGFYQQATFWVECTREVTDVVCSITAGRCNTLPVRGCTPFDFGLI